MPVQPKYWLQAISALISILTSFTFFQLLQSLRLYPQPPVLIRRSLGDDKLGKYPIKKLVLNNHKLFYEISIAQLKSFQLNLKSE